MTIATREPRLLVAASLVSVYFIWGSTYLALRFGLEGFPPFILNGLRFLLAGAVMYLVLRPRGAAAPTGRQAWNAGRMGLMLLVGGVGGMTLAIQSGIGSGVAATAAAVIPVWSGLAGGLVGQWPVRREWIGLATGLGGVVVLVQEGDFRATVIGLLFALIAPLLWSVGSVWGSRREMPEGLMSPAVQLLAAGAAMLVIGLAAGERIGSAPPARSLVALAYLVVFGSIVAYTAYLHLMRAVRPALANSYAYVNPVVAVVLGLTLGQESITGPALVALPLILVGVGLMVTAKQRQAREPSPELAEVLHQRSGSEAVRSADELGHPIVVGAGADLGQGTGLDDPAGAHDRHPVGDRLGLLVVVGDVEGGGAPAPQQLSDLGHQPLAQPAVERPHRLIEHHQPGLGGHGAGQGHPLLLPSRQALDAAAGEALQPHPGERLLHPSVHLAAVEAEHPQPERHVAPHRLVREEGVALEHEPEPALVGRDVA